MRFHAGVRVDHFVVIVEEAKNLGFGNVRGENFDGLDFYGGV